MTPALRQLLDSFDALPEAAKHEAAVEILRRTTAKGDLPESSLLEASDELFRNLDAEADHASS
jgi:hypothetical protein